MKKYHLQDVKDEILSETITEGKRLTEENAKLREDNKLYVEILTGIRYLLRKQ